MLNESETHYILGLLHKDKALHQSLEQSTLANGLITKLEALNMELRQVCVVRKQQIEDHLVREGLSTSSDGRLFSTLTLSELEAELMFFKEGSFEIRKRGFKGACKS